MSFVYRMHVDAGATLIRQFEYTNPDGSPVDMTGYTARFQARFQPHTSLIIEAEPDIDVENGLVTLTLTAEQTSLLVWPEYVYAIELTHETGEPVIRLVGGSLVVSPEVVRIEGP